MVVEATADYSEFKEYLAKNEWGHLGRDSLAVKLGVGAHVIHSALNNGKINPRSRYLLWVATGRQLSCFQQENLTDLLEWMYQNDETVSSLSKKTAIKGQTLSSTVYKDSTPLKENAEALYRVTGLARFAPEEDPREVTARLIQDKHTPQETPTRLPDKSNSFGPRVDELECQVKDLTQRFRLLEEQLGISSPAEKLLVEEAAEIFGKLIVCLKLLKDAVPQQRSEFIQAVGPKPYGHWVGMLSALSDEKQFQAWQKMSNLD